MAQKPAISLIAPSFQRREFLLLTQAPCAIMVIDICWNVLPAWPWAVRLIHFHREAVRRRGRGEEALPSVAPTLSPASSMASGPPPRDRQRSESLYSVHGTSG